MGKLIKYPITEIFRSVQGEGYNAGRPAVFIRFSGCNMNPPCSFCDTDYSLKKTMDLTQIDKAVQDIGRSKDIIVLTGGEPTLQKIIPIIQMFGPCNVCIETNGLFPRRLCEIRAKCRDVWITVSPKQQRISYTSFQYANEIKLVFDGVLDPEKIKKKIPTHLLMNHHCYIQPCSENFQPAVDYVLSHPWWRLSVQIQKILNVR